MAVPVHRSPTLTVMVGRVALTTMLAGILLLRLGATADAARQAEAAVDVDAVAEFLSAAVPRSLDQHHVPGAVVAVVHDGEMVFADGYGMADVERGTAFDPDTSMVRIASISKLFTWTAVMQLVEDGALDLDEDVNTYLDSFQVPDTYPEPVTLDHLMTHTAGFEERVIGIAARDKRDVPPLGGYLAAHLPARVRPPGEISAYSNHGAALAGHIVSEVSGKPYERYIEDHILRPLDMWHSTAWEPVPDRLAAHQARSYEHVDGRYEPVPFVFDKLVPDGSVSASAADMANFVIAHLGDGRLGDTRILGRDTAVLMQERSFTAHPAVDGWAHGFKERTFNGWRTIMHDGSWEQFQSTMVLIPDADLGLFISYNGDGGIEAAGDVLTAFFDRALPAPAEPARPVPAGDAGSSGGIDGFYQGTRSSFTTAEKVQTLVGPSRASVSDDGILRFSGREWSPVGPSVYQEVDGTDRLAVVRDDDGAVRYLATDTAAYQPLAWHETLPVNLVVLGLFAVSALTILLGWPAMALVRRMRKRPVPARSRSWRTARRLMATGSATGLGFLVLLLMTLLGDTGDFLYGVPLDFGVLMVAPVVFVGLVIATAVKTVRAWRSTPTGLATRAQSVVVVAGMVSLVWFLQQWNLIGWRFG